MADFNTSVAKSKNWEQLTEALDLQSGDYLLICRNGQIEPLKILKSNIQFAGEPITDFTDLNDVPSQYLGQAGKALIVKATEDGLEYKTLEEVQGITAQSIANALGYTPADDAEVQNHETRITTLENSGASVSPTRIDSWVLGYDSGLTFNPTFNFTIDGVSGSDSRQITLAAADPTNPRKDTFVVNISTQQIEVITGTPAANPFEPDIDFSIYLKGPVVDIPAGATTPANINITTVWNENTGTGGGEWNISNPHADYDYDNTENPSVGTKAVKVVGELVVNQILGFAAGADIPVSEAKEFQFDIQNITTGGAFHVTLIGKRSNGRTESLQLPAPTGFDPDNVSSYQTITLPISTNQLVSIHEIRFITEVAGYKFYFDYARLIGGEGTTAPSGDYVTRTEFETLDSEVVKSVSLNGGTPQTPDGSGNVDLTVSTGSNYTPPADYNDKAALLADQANQVQNEEYTMKNANGWDDPNQDAITHSGWATVKYLGTTNGNESDYELREQQDFDNNSGIFEGNVWRPELLEANTAQQNADLINAAITAADPVNGSVILPAGDFDCRTINYKPNVRLRGQGTNATKLTSTNAEPLISHTETNLKTFVQISDMTLFGGVDQNNKIGTIGIQTGRLAQFHFCNLRIENFVNTGIDIIGVITGSFDHVYVRYCDTGIKAIAGSSNYGTLKPNLVVFRSCTVSLCPTWGIDWVAGTSIHIDKGCNLEYCGTSGNANTGVIKFDSTGAYSTDEFGLSLEGSWFEQNNGTVVKITSHTANTRHRIASTMVNSGSISNVIELNEGKLMVSECDFKVYTINVTAGEIETRNVTNGAVTLATGAKHVKHGVLNLTGTEWDLGSRDGTNYNYGAASSATTYTFKNLVEGGNAIGLINATSEPTVTGGTQIAGSAFVTNSDMELVMEVKNGAVRYFFLTI